MWTNSFESEPYGERGMAFYEPLAVAAPPSARPHGCYLNTVIFYDRAAWERGVIVKLAECETQWHLLGQRWTDAEGLGWYGVAPFVRHAGTLFELASGEVVYRAGRWQMRWLAWRVRADDRRLLLGIARAEVGVTPGGN